MPRYRLLPLIIALVLFPITGFSLPTEGAGKSMATAAQAWLDALTPTQRKTAVFEFTHPERENWHYIPKAREGLPLADMSEGQRKLARVLLASGLGESGILKAEAIMALENVLRAMENSDHRDPLRYFFTVFGTPATGGTWGWRFEGHHVSVNFTIVDGQFITATPTFMGANPAEVRITGPQQGKRVLAAEEDLGRALVVALDPTQLGVALISEHAPGDILTRNDKQAKPQEPAGLGYGKMNQAQQTQLRKLVELYAHRLTSDVAEAELKKIADTGWNRLSFAWAGSVKPGEGHYYRIQSQDFVIEYDNTQNNANHIHTVWRVFDGDFGRDLLQEHYRKSHK